MNKHDNKVWNDYRDKVEWYFSQEWSDRPYYEVLYGELKKPIDDELSEKNILIHERAESIIWEAWNAGSNVQSAAYFLWMFFKKVGKFDLPLLEDKRKEPPKND